MSGKLNALLWLVSMTRSQGLYLESRKLDHTWEMFTQKYIICSISIPLHWTCVHRVYRWRLGWSTSLWWGSMLTIETFAIFNSTCVLPTVILSKVCAQVSTKILQLTQICSDTKILVPLVLPALLSVQLYKGDSSLNVISPSTVCALYHKYVYV